MKREAAAAVGKRQLEMMSSVPRIDEWYFDKLGEHVHGDVLEIGAGIGSLSVRLRPKARSLVVTEVDAPLLARLDERFAGDPKVEVLRYDLEGPAPAAIADRRFDVVFSCNVLEHLEDDVAATRRLVDLLRPGGWFLAYVPAVPWAFGTLDEAVGHHRRYTHGTLGKLVEDAGLSLVRLEAMNPLGLLGWFVNGRIFRRASPGGGQMKLFERLVPALRALERRPPPIGLGLIVHARKPGRTTP
ncbi:MAG: methyltransferase [Myxococcota bacterium]